MGKLQPYILGALFVSAGALHFRNPQAYERIVPPYLPAHRTLVAVSGAFEILGGAGLLVPRTRVFAAWGLIALLFAVFPANAYMASDASAYSFVPAWALCARLPLQFVLMWWIYRACVATRTRRNEGR